jgi:heme-degrading monooxygenase HmoA
MVIDVVSFRLRDGVPDETFLVLTRQAEREFLQQQPGFLGRELLKGANGEWIGLLRWDSSVQADQAHRTWDEHPLASQLDDLCQPDGTSIIRCLPIPSVG